MIKNALSLILATLFVAVLSGCDGDNTDSSSPNRSNQNSSGISSVFVTDDISYLAESQDLDFGGSVVRAITAQGDFLYCLVSDWSETEERSAYSIVRVSLADSSKEEIPLNFLAGSENPLAMVLNGQGNFLLLTSLWSEETETSSYTLHEVSIAGAKISERNVRELLGLDESLFVLGMYEGYDNGLCFIASDGIDYQLLATNEAGQVMGRITCRDLIEAVICTEKGEVYVSTRNQMMERAIRPADFANSSLGGDIGMAGLSGKGRVSFVSNGAGGILANDGTSLYACDFKKNVATKMLDWLDCGVMGGNVAYFGQLGDGSFWVFKGWQQGSGNELLVLHKTTYGELPPRETIVLGTYYMGSRELAEAIADFNNSNQRYRIEVREYYDEKNGEASRLAWDLALTGSELDIIANSDDIPNLAAKGVLEDLNPYFDGSGLDRGDYFENVLNAYDIDGKLYAVATKFSIRTLVGHASRLEGRDRWTIEEMISWAEGYLEARVLESSDSFLYVSTYSSANNFIDWERGKVNFASDEFIRTLEFAAEIGARNREHQSAEVGREEALASGQLLLREWQVVTLSDIQYLDALFGGEARFIGWPAKEGSGIYMQPENPLAIAAKSQHKEVAFAFIRYMLADAYQGKADEDGGFSLIAVKRSGVEAQIARQTTIPEGKDVDGGERYLIDHGNGLKIYASRNPAYIADFYELISRADSLMEVSGPIKVIVDEETAAFFAGQKTAREVAEIIESRVQVYVNEGR